MKAIRHLLLLLFVGFLQNFNTASASHIIGGELSYEYLGNQQYVVTAKLYRDCSSTIAPFAQIYISVIEESINYSGGVSCSMVSTTDVTQVCASEPTTCSGISTAVYGVEVITYQGTITLPSPSDYNFPNTHVLFKWEDCCLSNNSTLGNVNFYIYATAYTYQDLEDSTYSLPISTTAPVFNTCVGSDIVQGNTLNDTDGDSLFYSLSGLPTSISFNIDNIVIHSYNNGYSATQPIMTTGSINVESATGNMSFQPSTVEAGIFNTKIEEYRNGRKLSEKNIFQLLTVSACTNQAPKISGINGTATATGVTGNTSENVQVGVPVCLDFQVHDNLNQNVDVSWNSSLTNATFTLNTTGATESLTVCWTPTADDIGFQSINIIAADDNCPIVGQAIKSFRLNVLPNPIIEGSITLNGSPFNDGTIYLMDSTKSIIDSTVNTTGSYRFTIDDTGNNYYVSVKPDLDKRADITYYSERPVLNDATNIPIIDITNIANIVMLDTSIFLGPGTIKGVVTDGLTGSPLSGVRIILVDEDFKYRKSAISKSDGSIVFYKVQINENISFWLDDLEINNTIAPYTRLFSGGMLSQDGLQFELYDNYLDLSYPTNTVGTTIFNSFEITPNPSNGQFQISFESPKNEILKIEVLNLNGQLVKKIENIDNNQSKILLDLTELPSKGYLIRLIGKEGVSTKKIIKN